MKMPKDLPFSNLYVASKLAPEIPENSVFHFGILSSLRSWNYFDLDNSIRCYSNIGVHQNLPLHNLHYVINQAFGFTNSHMHEFELSSVDLKWVTAGKVENWKKLVGLVFKNPLRDEDLDFWDDDYEGGSPKKWMRSKYTGPGYVKCYEEGYRNVIQELGNWKVKAKSLEELLHKYESNPFSVNEVLCKECQAEVRKRQNAESHLRKKEGTTRKIGSEASCERCGRPYIVKGATQKYCENCAGIMIQEKARKRYVPKEAATLICQICGKEFTSTARNKPKYCSDECREKGLRRYYKELWQKQKAEKEKEKK